MTNTLDEAIEILQAYRDGKIIEIWMGSTIGKGEWSSIICVAGGEKIPVFNFMRESYRIRPTQ